VARLGGARLASPRLAEQARADGARGADGQGTPRGDPERSGAPDDKRGRRVDERTDSSYRAVGLRLQETRALPEQDPLPFLGDSISTRGLRQPTRKPEAQLNESRIVESEMEEHNVTDPAKSGELARSEPFPPEHFQV